MQGANCFFFFFSHGDSFKSLDGYEAVIGVSLLPWQRTRRRRGARIPEPRRQCLLCRCAFCGFFASGMHLQTLPWTWSRCSLCTNLHSRHIHRISQCGVCWCVLSTFCHLSLGGIYAFAFIFSYPLRLFAGPPPFPTRSTSSLCEIFELARHVCVLSDGSCYVLLFFLFSFFQAIKGVAVATLL